MASGISKLFGQTYKKVKSDSTTQLAASPPQKKVGKIQRENRLSKVSVEINAQKWAEQEESLAGTATSKGTEAAKRITETRRTHASHLCLSGLGLHSFPPLNSDYLTTLNLSDNQFHTAYQLDQEDHLNNIIPRNYFKNLPNLRSLDLSTNQLFTVPTDMVTHNPHLETLNLKQNNLISAEAPLLDNQTYLKDLDLSHNSLDRVDSTLLKKCESLETVKLSNNKNLEHIDKKAFEFCSNLKVIDLRNTPNLPKRVVDELVLPSSTTKVLR